MNKELRIILTIQLTCGCALFEGDPPLRTYCEKHPVEAQLRAMRVLEDLTPGGSEFYASPENCAAFIRHRLDTQRDAIIRAKRRLAPATFTQSPATLALPRGAFGPDDRP